MKKQELPSRNKEELNKQNKEWASIHPKETKIIQKKSKAKRKVRYRNDPEYNIRCRLRWSFNQMFKRYINDKKQFHSNKYGIGFDEIIEHLKPFPKKISEYHIDHITPLCSFRFINNDGSINMELIQKAFSKDNLRWLKARDNIIKGQQDRKISIRTKN